MHLLLCLGDDADTLGPALATAWRDAAPRCTVETVALAEAPAAPADGPHRAGVFVPLSALGLGSVTGPAEDPLGARAQAADLVVVHVPVLDTGATHEGRVAQAVRAAAPHAVPVVVLAGRSEISRREWSGAGISGVHEVGPDPAAAVARVARTWAPTWA